MASFPLTILTFNGKKVVISTNNLSILMLPNTILYVLEVKMEYLRLNSVDIYPQNLV